MAKEMKMMTMLTTMMILFLILIRNIILSFLLWKLYEVLSATRDTFSLTWIANHGKNTHRCNSRRESNQVHPETKHYNRIRDERLLDSYFDYYFNNDDYRIGGVVCSVSSLHAPYPRFESR